MAEDGLTAALCYAGIAPAVYRMPSHMPSHIFTRLGMWRRSIDANRAATAAGLAYVEEELGPDAFDGEAVHSMDYMEYAYLQMGQDRDAKRVVDELLTFKQANVPNLPMAYCSCGDAGALCGRTPELGGGRRRHRAPDAVSVGALPVGRGDDLVYAGARRGSYRRYCRSRDRNCQAAVLEAEARPGQGRLLGQAGRGPTAGRLRILAQRKGEDKQAIELGPCRAPISTPRWTSTGDPGRGAAAREVLPTCCSSSMSLLRR